MGAESSESSDLVWCWFTGRMCERAVYEACDTVKEEISDAHFVDDDGRRDY